MIDHFTFLFYFFKVIILLITYGFFMSKLGNFNIMKNKKTKAIDGNLGHVSKFAHTFYFVKLSPIDQESISKIKKEEKVIQEMNQDICEITEMITKKGVYNNRKLYF